MDEAEDKILQDKTLDFVKRNFFILCLFIVGFLLIGIGLFQALGTKEAEIKFEQGERLESLDSEIKVDVSGEVMQPGVYSLKSDSRIQDALIAAGGLSPDADRDYIGKNVNLAQVISDGSKIYIPKKGEEVSLEASVGLVMSENSSKNGSVSINSGTESDLDTLPGVGPVTARKIIDNRPYASIEDLRTKDAVGEATFQKIKDLISL